MKRKQLLFSAILGTFAISMTGCSSDSDVITDSNNGSAGQTGKRTFFNVVAGVNVEGNGSTYAAAYTDLSASVSEISFNGWGYEVPSVRTARVYASGAGDYLYNLSYGGGTISKYLVQGGQSYSHVSTLDISLAMGTTNPRWTKLNDQYALLHNVVTTPVFDQDVYSYVNTTGILTAIDLEKFSIITDYNETGGVEFDFPRTEEDIRENLHVWRIDAPVLCGDKAYYGLNKRLYNPNTSTNISTSDYFASTLVVDFPSLQNPRIITSTQGKGSTQGYRTPVAHMDEKGDIYQITAAPSTILKISGEEYDNHYAFDLSNVLGMNVGSNGWFYVGDGIGYVPFYDVDKGSGSDVAAWGLARVDLYNKSAVKLNMPENLWLYQYQNGVIGDDGKFYMAIAPLGGTGNIYIFDPESDSADGFEIGASIKTIDSSSAYLGIF